MSGCGGSRPGAGDVCSVDVLLLRHGQSTWNVQRRWAGQADPPLSVGGRRSCELLVEALSACGFGAVASSDLVRARETAHILGGRLGLGGALLDPRLRERAAARWSGRTAVEIERLHPGRLAQWRAGVFYDIPGAEPWDEFAARVEAGVRSVAEQLRGHGQLLVVTHAGALRAVELSLGLGVRKTTNLDGYWVRVDADGLHAVDEFRHPRPALSTGPMRAGARGQT